MSRNASSLSVQLLKNGVSSKQGKRGNGFEADAKWRVTNCNNNKPWN